MPPNSPKCELPSEAFLLKCIALMNIASIIVKVVYCCSAYMENDNLAMLPCVGIQSCAVLHRRPRSNGHLALSMLHTFFLVPETRSNNDQQKYNPNQSSWAQKGRQKPDRQMLLHKSVLTSLLTEDSNFAPRGDSNTFLSRTQ